MNTGEFAKLCGTKKRTLFLYDQMGLLKPAAIHENGYREYLPGQIETMDAIRILQASGYTLKEIKEIICADAAYRRNCFFGAKSSIEARIDELVGMRDYISKKEQLWQEYLDFRGDGRQYKLIDCDITYMEKRISDTSHFFGFIQDGDYDAFILDETGRMSVFRECPRGVHREGRAICFFMETPSVSTDIMDVIRGKLEEFRFRGEKKYYMRSLPHLLTEHAGRAIIKVIVFEDV